MAGSILEGLYVVGFIIIVLSFGIGIGLWIDKDIKICPDCYYNLTCTQANISLECPKPNVVTECPACDYECPACECPQCYYTKEIYTSHFQQIISSVKEERDYEYDHMNWNCDEMAEELKKRLRNAGYDARMECGWYDDGEMKERHCWVVVNKLIVEATNGEIVHSDNYDYYKS